MSKFFQDSRFTKFVLDHGYVQLIDVMPYPESLEEGETCDSAIANSARVSYQKGTTRKQSDKQLIKYLFRNGHTSPFEQVEFRFELRVPISVERQLVRHRTASLNIESSRYSVMEDVMYIPEELREQSTTNKQGSVSGNFIPATAGTNQQDLINLIRRTQKDSYAAYQTLIDNKVGREISRDILPLSLYTRMVWKCDLLNLLKMLRLRIDSHAQYEIRQYANAMLDLIREFVPWTVEAFEEYWVNGMTLSSKEILLLSTLIDPEEASEDFLKEKSTAVYDDINLSKGEIEDFKKKLKRIIYREEA